MEGMKTPALYLALLLAGSLAVPAFAQSSDDKSVGQDIKDAGTSSKKAVKKGATKSTETVKKGATATGHGVKKGANKAASETEKGANKVKEKTTTTSTQP
jgi:hypothetical protein